MFQKLALLLAFTASTLAFTVRQVDVGQCPELMNKEDLEVAPYLGRWFEIERFSLIFEAFEDCVQADYSLLDDGYVQVHNTARTAGGEFDEIIGRASVTAPGVLLVEFPGHASAEYHVLDTDYENFSAVYNCDQVGELRWQYAWILSRTGTIPDDAIYQRAKDAFTNNNIELNGFHQTYQGEDCPYLPKKLF